MTKETRAFVAVTVAPNEEGLRMRLRKTLRGLCVVGALACALAVLGAAPALASYTHVFSGSFGEAGSGDGQLSLVAGVERGEGGSGVAVNSSTHDVYVADTGNRRVDEFSASGAFIRAWGWGVADGTTEALQSCTSGCHAGLPGDGAGQFNEPSFVAVDNSGGPSQGDVYVADRTSGGSMFVAKFTASGGYLSSNDGSGAIFPVPGPFGSGNGGIAVDTSGDLWVIFSGVAFGGTMFEFAQDGGFITDFTVGEGAHESVLAIDSAHNLYFASFLGAGKYRSSGELIGTVRRNHGGFTGLAVNPTTNDLYVNEALFGVLARYASSCDPTYGSCTPVEEFGSGGELNNPGNLAVDQATDTVYVVDVGDGRIAVFGRTPDVATGATVSRAATAAVISGTVDPDNTAVSDCHFDYVPDAEYAASESNPYAAGGTVPCDTTPSGAGPATVHAEITGLTPGVVYHFRLQATNAYGASLGRDETVPGTPPAIDSTSAAEVTSVAAVLQARINPDGGDTTYRFEYGPTAGYGTSVPVPDGDLGAGAGDVPARDRVQGLLAGTVYHYRVVARNMLGTTVGPDRAITTQPSGGGIADSCPNAALRVQQHAAGLLDCRAYEQVSPADKDGSPILGALDNEHRWQASPDGDAVTYTSSGVFADAQAGDSVVSPYLSARGQGGWSTHDLLPPQSATEVLPFNQMAAFSTDLSKSIFLEKGKDQPLLVPGEPANNWNLFLRDNVTGSYQLVDLTPPGVASAPEMSVGSFSPDLSHVVFSENAQLTPDSPPAGSGTHLYEWSAGALRLVSVLPDGTAVPSSFTAVTIGTTADAVGASVTVLDNHAVSDDGSRVFFEVYGSGSRRLYLRQNARTTVQLDAAHGSGPGGEGQFKVASSDGSLAFFTDDAAQGLTSDTVPGSGTNLYRYDANSGTLTDVTAVAGAEVQGVLGASQDGSSVYYVANGVLAPGASPGDCQSAFSQAGLNCNLYLFHNGVTTFIAAVDGEDGSDWYGNPYTLNGTSVVSSDGRFLAFDSLDNLTGYDTLAASGVRCDPSGEGPRSHCSEVYLYDAAAGKLSCPSCNPSGGAPDGSSLLGAPSGVGAGGDGMRNYMPRYLSDSGRVFFNSRDALVPQDINGQWDVYEYEPSGMESCQQAQGCVSLISSGTSPYVSIFRDASVSGGDVFLTTSDRLVAQDGDQSRDLYDARVDGGIASQNEGPAAACAGEACKAPALGQSGEQAPGSSGFAGPGNPAPAPTAAVRARSLTRAQKLARALRVCKSKPKRKRASCIAQAKRRYGASAKGASRTKRARRANNDRRAGR
jgi:hypothetical protein